MNNQFMPNNNYNDQYGNSGQNQHFQKDARKRKSKTGIIIAIVVIVLALCCCGGGLIGILLKVAKGADPIDFKEFEQGMYDLGYSDYEMNTSTYMTFHNDDYSAEVSIQDLSTVELAKSYEIDYENIYTTEVAKFKSTVSGRNYERITWNTDYTYYLIYRVDTTILVAYSSEKDDIDAIKDLIK